MSDYFSHGDPLWPTGPPRGHHVDGGGELRTSWGPREWRGLHVAAIFFPAAPTECDRKKAFLDLWTRIHNLPCSECRKHAAAYARRFPPDFSGSAGYQTWVWRFHNSVNRRLNKPLCSGEEYNRCFRAQLAEAAARRQPVLTH